MLRAPPAWPGHSPPAHLRYPIAAHRHTAPPVVTTAMLPPREVTSLPAQSIRRFRRRDSYAS